ncbi:hypothetical protein [Aestuariirhabdus litorea]|uniref:DUF1269 domain-containing protein n=1 Tax=Aestuariirhabdus litorea TaxID=2528527 RepID=A0A3P3VRJ2_9GAMM|nr:hypothetical protein [Aestuariirhabdus litorea]RRJ84306.1 hypothetical protein D0544_04145 [Aestuariirhabdus litorea]RWW97529.1 hypothetical protein DZC74_04145 [Endozoicomonadaceae bacterium GTF-13]
MKRLYYLTDSIESAEQISEDLHAEGVSDWRFHIISRDTEGLMHHQLRAATPLHSTNIVHSGERGAIMGGLSGLLISLLIIGTQPVGEQISSTAVILITALCIISGGWVGALSGRHQQNYKTARFQRAIDAGQYLLIVDTRSHEELAVRTIMQRYHPDVPLAGIDSPLTNPFASESEPIPPPR